MPYVLVFEPLGIRLLAEQPMTIADAARQAGVPIRMECGGKGTCGKCRVQPFPNPANQTMFEQQLLGEYLAEGWRLACRTVVSGLTRVDIPAASQATLQVVQTDGKTTHSEVDPTVAVYPITVQSPTLHDQASDFDRLSRAILDRYGVTLTCSSLAELGQLSRVMREQAGQVIVAARMDELIAVYPGVHERLLGFAVDVGTTKLACYLVNLSTGQVLATKGLMNPQLSFGEDIMSRLQAVLSDPRNGPRHQSAVVRALASAAEELCELVGEHPDRIVDACMVGNTAMHHLVLGLPTSSLAVSPFVPVINQALDIPAHEIGFTFAPGARVHFPAPIAGFVGSDHLAFLLAEEFGKDDRIRVGVDIGTNTEIILQAKGRLVSCSTASGPAFEGAHITHGMRAAPGAIEHVRIDGQGRAECQVIGGEPPIGICGSGILDALSELYRVGLINSRGRMQIAEPNIRLDRNGAPSYHLTGGQDSQREIVITQADIDQLLLAKGAIRAGIEILMQHLDVTAEQINEIVLAGAFGTYLDPANAIRIGLLPDIPPAKIHAVGNAAGAGARWMLVSRTAREQAARLGREIKYLELTVYPGFSKYFARGACLPKL